MSNVRIEAAQTPEDFKEARYIIEEYAAWLGVDFCLIGFEKEMETLPVMYGPPSGSLLLARQGDELVGTVGMRPYKDGACELKRLYVRPLARGGGLGRRLAARIVEQARQAGYRRVLLDTLERMTAARAIYRSLGFRQMEPYYANPIPNVVFMELDLFGPSGDALHPVEHHGVL